MKRKRKKLTRTEIALSNAERQFQLEQDAIEFAKAVRDEHLPWQTQRALIKLLRSAVAYWRGVQR